MGWLGSIGKKASKVENLDEKLLATNDPLEAFGNAKTVHSGAPRAVGPRFFLFIPLAASPRPTDRPTLGPCGPQVNNDNSSRFAKCMQIALSKQGEVLGAEIQTSLSGPARGV